MPDTEPTSLPLSGADLRRHRRDAGLTQTQLAKRAGVSRETVQYWEAKPAIDWRFGAPNRFAEALGLRVYVTTNARVGGWGLRLDREIETRLSEQILLLQQREAQRLARSRVTCGAMTRKGTACRMLSEAGKRRCKYHGGKSTGPKTNEGKARIAEAQRRRWARQANQQRDFS